MLAIPGAQARGKGAKPHCAVRCLGDRGHIIISKPILVGELAGPFSCQMHDALILRPDPQLPPVIRKKRLDESQGDRSAICPHRGHAMPDLILQAIQALA